MIMIKKILVPTDLSSISAPAVGYASSLARDLDAEVVLLHVLPTEAMKKHFSAGYGEGLVIPGDTAVNVKPRPDADAFYEQKKQLLQAFVQQKISSELRQTVKIRPLARLGKVVDEILAAAREEQCDLIVMTSDGGRLRHLFGGSITERVVRQAPCPVLSMQPSAQIRMDKDQRLQVRSINQWAA